MLFELVLKLIFFFWIIIGTILAFDVDDQVSVAVPQLSFIFVNPFLWLGLTAIFICCYLRFDFIYNIFKKFLSFVLHKDF